MPIVLCVHCRTSVTRTPSELAKNKNTFCDQRCKALYERTSRVGRVPVNFGRLMEWSPDLAYAIGLLAADGNVHRPTGQVSLVSGDLELVSFVRDFFAPTSRVDRGHSAVGNPYFRWRLFSRELIDQLARFGIVERKSRIVRMPDVPSRLVWHYVRGFFDGDGSADKKGRVDFTTVSVDLANDLKVVFDSAALRYSVREWLGAQVIRFTVLESRRLACLMYSEGGPYLPRKRERLTSASASLATGSAASPRAQDS